jgi:hypothetical protein
MIPSQRPSRVELINGVHGLEDPRSFMGANGEEGAGAIYQGLEPGLKSSHVSASHRQSEIFPVTINSHKGFLNPKYKKVRWDTLDGRISLHSLAPPSSLYTKP